jgi:hypothetical protein
MRRKLVSRIARTLLGHDVKILLHKFLNDVFLIVIDCIVLTNCANWCSRVVAFEHWLTRYAFASPIKPPKLQWGKGVTTLDSAFALATVIHFLLSGSCVRACVFGNSVKSVLALLYWSYRLRGLNSRKKYR